MATDQIYPGHYFDTPARAERLQLLLHLVRNAGQVIYLRGPAGAGKTLFAQRLLDMLGDQAATVWVRASEDCDVAAVAVDQLSLPPEEISPWPNAVMAGLGDRTLLVIVDDADRLGLQAAESLAALHACGARLLLLGQGRLAQTSGNWDVQFVDLPAFEPEQTVAFLRSMAGVQATRVTDDLAAGLHRASKGLPGPLLDALVGILGSAERHSGARSAAADVPERPRQPAWYWLAGGALILLLAAALLFQDQITGLFEPNQASTDRPAVAVLEAVEQKIAIKHPPDTDILPAEALQAEAVSAPMPGFALPDPDSAPDESVKALEDRAAAPGQFVPATGPDQATETSAETVHSRTGVDREDPLDAVMRDALEAVQVSEGPDPAATEPVAEDHEPDKKVPANAAATTESATREVDPTVVETMPEVSVPATAGKPWSKRPEPQVAAAVPAPVESRQASAGPPVARVEPAVVTPAPVESRQAREKPSVVRTQPAVIVSEAAPRHGSSWLNSRVPGHYTLQLVGARDPTAVQKFVRDHGIKEPYAIFARHLKGKPWYSLVAGDYPNRDAAIAARGRLPKGLERSGVWPRTFGSIQKVQ